MGRVPYEMKPQSGLVVQGGASGCFEIGFPSRCYITKIIIEQVGGVGVDFVAALYNHEGVCQGASASDSDGPLTGTLPPNLFRVTPDLQGTAGLLLYFAQAAGAGIGFPFYSHDRRDLRGVDVGNSRLIYLKITPGGSGAKTYAVALGGDIYS